MVVRALRGRRSAVYLGALLSAALTVALVTSGTAEAMPKHATVHKQHTTIVGQKALAKKLAGKHIKVAVALSYYGNSWQTEALDEIKAEAATPPYKGHITLRVDISGTSPTAQIAEINNDVAAGEKAIIMYPISETALNGAIEKACKAGVAVYAYNSYVTAPCAHNVTTSDLEFGTLQARGLVKFLHGKGNIAEMTGVAGTSANANRVAGWASVLKKYPKIHVVATADGEWTAAVTQSAFSSLFAAHPTVTGVLAETSCQAVEAALQASGHKMLPCAGESENEWREDMLAKSKGGAGVNGISVGGPVYTGELAFINAISELTGHKVPLDMEVPLPYVTSSTLKPGTAATHDVARGKNVFTAKSGLTLATDFFDDVWSPLVNQGITAALNGKPNVVSEALPCSKVKGCITGSSTKLFLTFAAGTVSE